MEDQTAVRQRLEVALDLCRFPPIKAGIAPRLIGAGAWHDAYLITLRDGTELVIRLRKAIIYGRQEAFDARVLREDYEPVGLYYRQANRCHPGICPAIYEYRLDPDLTFTIESYMGSSTPLMELSHEGAYDYGRSIGEFFRSMHALPPPIAGFGAIVWNGAGLEGRQREPLSRIWQAEQATLEEELDMLLASDLRFDRDMLRCKLRQIFEDRAFDSEPVALINRDITPENLLIREHRLAALVDPVPLLHNGTRYASWFPFCYGFLLPYLSDAPRYAHNRWRQQAALLRTIADGYAAAYIGGDTALKRAFEMEYILWIFCSVCDYYRMLQAPIDEETQLRTGGAHALTALVDAGVRELASINWD